MRYVFKESNIIDNQLLFWIILFIIVLMVLMTIVFIAKEIKNDK